MPVHCSLLGEVVRNNVPPHQAISSLPTELLERTFAERGQGPLPLSALLANWATDEVRVEGPNFWVYARRQGA